MLAAGPHKQILLVDLDVAGVDPLRRTLEDAGFVVRAITDGSAAVSALRERPPHLLIIDWDMPGFAALELIESVRSVRLPQPVRLIIISARSEEHDVVAGLQLGADDYIAKPFSVREVVARTCAVLRRTPVGRATDRGVPSNMRGAEYRLLDYLMAHPGRTFNRRQLLAQVWAGEGGIDERTVDVNVQRLRKILAQAGYEACIQTVRGFGYRLVTSNERAS